jgi:hypothetical protein
MRLKYFLTRGKTLRITGFLDFVRRPEFEILENNVSETGCFRPFPKHCGEAEWTPFQTH